MFLHADFCQDQLCLSCSLYMQFSRPLKYTAWLHDCTVCPLYGLPGLVVFGKAKQPFFAMEMCNMQFLQDWPALAT